MDLGEWILEYVIFGVQAIALSNDDAIDTAFGTAQTVTDTLITALDVHVTSATSSITIAGTPATDDVIYFQIYRDADAGGDTLAVDARALGVNAVHRIEHRTFSLLKP